MALADGLAKEDQVFKALALGALYTKMVYMVRSLMIPAYLGAGLQQLMAGAGFFIRNYILDAYNAVFVC